MAEEIEIKKSLRKEGTTKADVVINGKVVSKTGTPFITISFVRKNGFSMKRTKRTFFINYEYEKRIKKLCEDESITLKGEIINSGEVLIKNRVTRGFYMLRFEDETIEDVKTIYKINKGRL